MPDVSGMVRYAGTDDLARGAAARLLARLVELQATREGHVQVCLSGGRIANRVYEVFSERAQGSDLDPAAMEWWWSDERFVATEDPDRQAGHTLAILAGSLSLEPGQTHPMPSADGTADSSAAAASYAKELGDTEFDLCILGLGEDGHVASIFPDHPSFTEQHHTVIGVDDSPVAPASRISLAVPTLNRSREVWYLAAGPEKADAVARAFAGDPALPGGVVRGREHTLWLLDRAAASGIDYHDCSF